MEKLLDPLIRTATTYNENSLALDKQTLKLLKLQHWQLYKQTETFFEVAAQIGEAASKIEKQQNAQLQLTNLERDENTIENYTAIIFGVSM